MARTKALRQNETQSRGQSLRNKTLAAVWATAKAHGLDQARVYEIASAVVERPLQPGFGLSTLEQDELVKMLEAVKTAAGLPIGPRRAASPGPRRRKILPLRSDGERRASLGQYRLMAALREELGLTPEEFEGVAVRATGKPHSVAAADIAKIIEALKSIRLRRLRAGGSPRLDRPRPEDSPARGSSSGT